MAQRPTSNARLYHAEISGEAALPQDRDVLQELRKIFVQTAVPGAENRAFMMRAVAWLARAGIGQFLDIGAGMPAWGNVHEIASRFRSDVTVAYVDNDPEVVDSWRARSLDGSRIIAVQADVRRPREVLDHPEVRSLIDFSRPVGLLLGGVMHLVADRDDPMNIVCTLVDALAPGSFLVLSQATGDAQPPETVAGIRRIMSQVGIEATVRSRDQVARLFAGLEPVEPGVVPVTDWRPARSTHQPGTGWYVGGVGHKPEEPPGGSALTGRATDEPDGVGILEGDAGLRPPRGKVDDTGLDDVPGLQ
jgi:SAM-dependent methyltransferase